jgi:thioredoxin 1
LIYRIIRIKQYIKRRNKMSVIKINHNNFKTEVIESQQPVLLDFYADWCGPCKMLAPILEEIDIDYNGKVKICKLNVDNAQKLASQYGVRGIPALMVFKNGQHKEHVVGALPKKEIKALIDKHI